MDILKERQLNKYKTINSINVDSFDVIELSNNISNITEYEITNVLSATEQFDIEREGNEVYRIYGKIEYLSLLNGLKNNYKQLNDFFTPELIDPITLQPSLNSKNIFNSFEFYLIKPTTGYTKIINLQTEYVRYFEVIATPNDFELFPAGFSNNLFGEQTYCFNFNNDYDISQYYDEFGFPLIELFIYAKYKPKANGFTIPYPEAFKYKFWNETTGSESSLPINLNPLNIGDSVYGDMITYDINDFSQKIYSNQSYDIYTSYADENNNFLELAWKYNPFISLKLRYFTDVVYKANSGDTSYDLATSIPQYATKTDNSGNYVWRNIMEQGVFDPITNLGVDYPFINKRRYLFTNVILDIIPDLSHTNTNNVFKEIKFKSEIVNVVPITNVEEIGNPCQ